MASNTMSIEIQLSGIRPLMFDRYAGDNSTSLPVREKMYLDDQRRLIMPALNILSLLTAENTKSVCKLFFGRNGKNIALGIGSYTNITPFDIPILDDDGWITFTDFNEQIHVVRHVARLPKGIPNPKERPMLTLPWRIEFEMEYEENNYCSLENLRQAVTMGGTMGLGTFRPYFGRYELTKWKVS